MAGRLNVAVLTPAHVPALAHRIDGLTGGRYDAAERSSPPAGLQGWPSRTPMTAGFHNTGGRKAAGVAWVTRVFIANERRGKAKHKTGTSRAMMRWTAANNARRCPVSSVVDTRSISPSMSDSHAVEGVRCSGFQICALPN